MRKSKRVFVYGVLLGFIGLLTGAGGERILPPLPPPPVPPPVWPGELKPVDLKIRGEATGATARITIEEVFENTGSLPAEGTFLLPVPQEISIERFSIWMDGVEVGGELLDANQARGIYESIVRRRRDPALLSFLGNGLLSARIFPVPPGARRTLKISYSQVVPASGNFYQLALPLKATTETPPETLSISIALSSKQPLKTIYSPTHSVEVVRNSPTSASVSLEGTKKDFSQNFALYYSAGNEKISVDMIPYRISGEDGYFLLLLSPGSLIEQEVEAKNFLFILDTSGSMSGEKIQQAKGGLRFILEHLNPRDRFNLIAFSSGVRTLFDSLQRVNEETLTQARQFVDQVEAVGGTNIGDALSTALSMPAGSSLPCYAIFLTDGNPTEGKTDLEALLQDVAEQQKKLFSNRCRLFVFGVGTDVNVFFLDKLAQQNGGSSDYVFPSENIESKVSALYMKIKSPVLSSPTLSYDGIGVYDLYPQGLPDIFGGSQAVIAGRYSGSGSVTIRLQGRVGQKIQSSSYTLYFPARDEDKPYVARLWATRKIGHLLDEIRLKGSNPELISSVVALSRKYGILTPYTSFLVQEQPVPTPMAQMMTDRYLGQSAAAGAPAMSTSQEMAALKSAERAISPPEQTGESLRVIGEKAFVLRKGRWEDTEYQGETTKKVVFLSEEYFELLKNHPDIASYLSLGKSLIVKLGSDFIEIVPD